MKKIFLVTGIAAFSFASAQNTTDTFWVKPLMPIPRINSFQLPKTHPFNYTPRLYHLSPLHPQALDRAKLLYTLTNGDKVYALPQDNMPCIVPDMSQYNNFELVKPDMTPSTIPNPIYPQIIPLQFSPEKLKELQDHFNKK